MSNAHTIYLRTNSVLLILADTVCAFNKTESLLKFAHGKGEQTIVLLFTSTTEKKRGKPKFIKNILFSVTMEIHHVFYSLFFRQGGD